MPQRSFSLFKALLTGVETVSEASLMGRRIIQTSRVLATKGVLWLAGNKAPTPQLLREIFEDLGTTYIKLGQLIASSPSFFPAEYVEEFQKCLDKAPAISFEKIIKIVEGELGQPYHMVFTSIEREPLATASIAQVHAAKLLTGEDVVIKVQKPGVSHIIQTDFSFLYLATRLTEWFAPGLSKSAISGVISELQSGMLEECDFLQEARNLDQFNIFVKNINAENKVIAPTPFHEYTTAKLLTMTRFYGVSLVDLESIKSYVDSPVDTLTTALNTWFASLMFCDFFHADLHAGNLMVLKDGRIGFIDFGIVGRIPKEKWESLMGLVTAAQSADFELMAEAMVGIGMTKIQVDKIKLAEDLKYFINNVKGVDETVLRSGTVNENEVNKMVAKLAAIGEAHGIRFPRSFVLLVKQFLYFDRYIQVLAPEMNIFDDERLDLMPLLNGLVDGSKQ